MLTAKISEVFFSIQGEGLYAGTGHVFIRFFGCNIKCRYCDTNRNKFKKYSIVELIEKTKRLAEKHNAKYISLTGGEPLLQADFIKEFLSKFKTNKLKIYLETNGLFKAEFLKIKKQIDIVAMDFKIPSATGLKGLWAEHQDFLKACKTKKVFVKAIIGSKIKTAEIKKAAKLIYGINKNIVLVLQPIDQELSPAMIKRAMLYQKIALDDLIDVRIIPQIHKLIGVD